MKTEQGTWNPQTGFKVEKSNLTNNHKQLVIAFFDRELKNQESIYEVFRKQFPKAEIVLGTSGGEILGADLFHNSCVYVCVELETSLFRVYSDTLEDTHASFTTGENLGHKLMQDPNLQAVFILSEGLSVNGTTLVQGINKVVPQRIPISGGLASDYDRFQETRVGYNQDPTTKNVVAIGFYGDNLDIRTGSKDGWSIFGPIRTITKSLGPVLYELDGKPALELYKKYLGDEAKNLPSSALSFPSAIWSPDEDFDSYVIRTVLSVDEDEQSITFAGEIPQGHHMRLMWGKFDDLIEAASTSAKNASPFQRNEADVLSIMISCIGRKSLMGQRIINEVQNAAKHLGQNTCNIGFYSYGEIAKHQTYERSVLHNQTMTITTIAEVA